MIMLDRDSIRDVITFPKNKVGSCPLTNAPSKVDIDQLKELKLGIVGVKEDKEKVRHPEKNL